MRTVTEHTKVYPFEELSEDGQDKAIELLHDLNVSFEWWDLTYEDAANIGLKITEFDIDRGSFCHGDWTEDAEDVARLIIEQHGEACETHKDAKAFQEELDMLEKEYFANPDYDPEYKDFEDSDNYTSACLEFLRTVCEDYRIMLQKGYEYLTSEEKIIEAIKANEYEFTEDGKIF